MDKDAAINFFIFLLAGTSKNGRQEEFYKNFIQVDWLRDIMARLVTRGLIREIEYFFEVSGKKLHLS